MAILTLTFSEIVQTSVQVGDMIYYCNPSNNESPHSGIVQMGTCTAVTDYTVECNIGNGTVRPTVESFILFSKDKFANPSGLTGYFAEVCFKNNSTAEAELFSIGAEYFGSSK